MKICEAGRSSGCCRNPDIRTINTMGADTAGNFEIRAGNSVSITTETNGIRIAYTGGITVYDNTDGNIVIDNDLFTINLADDITITGDMIIGGDLSVNGTYYTVHAEHVYTEDDYIILREGATTPLGSGSYAGFQVTKYDGTNDGRLVIDNAGVARVGDVGDEQPLLTREEAANLNNGALLKWDAANSKAVDEGTVGSDLKPIKIVNGVATAVTNDLVSTQGNQTIAGSKRFSSTIITDANIDIYRDNTPRAWIDAYRDDVQQDNGITFNAFGKDNPSNSAGFMVIFDESDNTVRIILRKTINGVTTYGPVIASL